VVDKLLGNEADQPAPTAAAAYLGAASASNMDWRLEQTSSLGEKYLIPSQTREGRGPDRGCDRHDQLLRSFLILRLLGSSAVDSCPDHSNLSSPEHCQQSSRSLAKPRLSLWLDRHPFRAKLREPQALPNPQGLHGCSVRLCSQPGSLPGGIHGREPNDSQASWQVPSPLPTQKHLQRGGSASQDYILSTRVIGASCSPDAKGLQASHREALASTWAGSLTRIRSCRTARLLLLLANLRQG
jgi:hypothetical protein